MPNSHPYDDKAGYQKIGDQFCESGMMVVTINLRGAALFKDDTGKPTLLRQAHMQELFQLLGPNCSTQLFEAKTRSEIQKKDPGFVKLVDTFVEHSYRKVILEKLFPQPNASKITPEQKKYAKKISADTLPQILDRLENLELLEDLSSDDKFKFPKQVLEFEEFELDLNIGINPEELRRGVKDCLLNRQARAACTKSHINALKSAAEQCKSDGLKSVLITEDDIIFLKPPQEFLTIYNSAMKTLDQQEDWDVLMLGASGYMPGDKEHNADPMPENENLVKVRFSYGNFAYVVNAKSINKVVNILEAHISECKRNNSTSFPNDVVLSNAMEEGQLEVYGVNPKLIGCVPVAWSEVCNMRMDYTGILEKPWLVSKVIVPTNLSNNPNPPAFSNP